MTRLTPFAARNWATDAVAHDILHERDLDARAKFQHHFAAEIAARADALLAEDEADDLFEASWQPATVHQVGVGVRA